MQTRPPPTDASVCSLRCKQLDASWRTGKLGTTTFPSCCSGLTRDEPRRGATGLPTTWMTSMPVYQEGVWTTAAPTRATARLNLQSFPLQLDGLAELLKNRDTERGQKSNSPALGRGSSGSTPDALGEPETMSGHRLGRSRCSTSVLDLWSAYPNREATAPEALGKPTPPESQDRSGAADKIVGMSDTATVAAIAGAATLGSGVLSFFASRAGTRAQLANVNADIQKLQTSRVDQHREEQKHAFHEYLDSLGPLEIMIVAGEDTEEDEFLRALISFKPTALKTSLASDPEVVKALDNFTNVMLAVANRTEEKSETGGSFGEALKRSKEELYDEWEEARLAVMNSMRDAIAL